METEFDAVKALINERIDLAQNEEIVEEEQFIQLIADRVAELMESNMELFFNHLYRMDVDEREVARVLNLSADIEESVYLTIARLIYTRQKQRLETRKKFKQKDIDFWAEE